MKQIFSNIYSQQNSKGNIIIPLLIIIVIGFGVLLTSNETLYNQTITDQGILYEGEIEIDNQPNKNNLQLKNVSFKQAATPTTAPDACNHDGESEICKPADPLKCDCVAYLLKCENNICVDANLEKSKMSGTKESVCEKANAEKWCEIFSCGNNGWYCLGKPVIYLYPEKPMLVDVMVITQGKVVVSDPQIELFENSTQNNIYKGGWSQVYAFPTGLLVYKDNIYRELFYETETQKLKRPARGIALSQDNLESQLRNFITKLGLTRKDEQYEFLDWWIPKLKMIKTPYIYASILEPAEKKRLDTVIISPKPDTMIEFITYFAPLTNPEEIDQLQLPPAPQRKGFTAVEWGGVIGK